MKRLSVIVVLFGASIMTVTVGVLLSHAQQRQPHYAYPPPQSPIEAKYQNLGGRNSFLGSPIAEEKTTPDGRGRYRYYQGGVIYWSERTSAHEAHGAILERWAQLKYERGLLGYPITDEEVLWEGDTDVGRQSRFEGGVIEWRRADGSVSVRREVIGHPTEPNPANELDVDFSGDLAVGVVEGALRNKSSRRYSCVQFDWILRTNDGDGRRKLGKFIRFAHDIGPHETFKYRFKYDINRVREIIGESDYSLGLDRILGHCPDMTHNGVRFVYPPDEYYRDPQ